MTECWAPVVLGMGFSEPVYEVSDQGRIRNRTTGRILKPYRCPTRNGEYLKVDLRQNGGRFLRFVHQVVAAAWCPNPYDKPEVNHFDTDHFNNAALNLEWLTRREQEMHKRYMRVTA